MQKNMHDIVEGINILDFIFSNNDISPYIKLNHDNLVVIKEKEQVNTIQYADKGMCVKFLLQEKTGGLKLDIYIESEKEIHWDCLSLIFHIHNEAENNVYFEKYELSFIQRSNSYFYRVKKWFSKDVVEKCYRVSEISRNTIRLEINNIQEYLKPGTIYTWNANLIRSDVPVYSDRDICLTGESWIDVESFRHLQIDI